MYTLVAYHEKPERYEEAEPENIRASSHPRRFDPFLVLGTDAAGHSSRIVTQ